ncbi:MAG: hypothetical protein M1825_001722 [Sarcosagium campestre]|nr:MAG: hypothetical protein M1825_001722 [Sarcosagium campestre]
MSTLLPAAVYGLEVPHGDVITPALPDFPATFRITMAALDPSVPAKGANAHSTLKIIRRPIGDIDDSDDDDSDSDDNEYLQALRARMEGGYSDDEDESSEDEDKNGGPSDPAKSKKAREEKALAEIRKELEDADAMEEDDDDDVKIAINGSAKAKGKAKATATGLEQESDEDDDEGESLDFEEFVLCTLDLSKNYQQPLDLTVGEHEEVFFKVSGSHTVYLTGNYVIPPDDISSRYDDEDEDDEEYDLSPDEDELDMLDVDESDDLDDLDDPRITELDSDENEPAPKLVVNKAEKKGKNKRSAKDSDDEPASLDDIMAKSLKSGDAATNGEAKLSKKQLKKLKNNAGEAVAATPEAKTSKADREASPGGSNNSKGDKKVQFAKVLEQGPAAKGATKAKDDGKSEAKSDATSKASLGVKTVQGVTIDDKKLGKGPVAKKGSSVTMRYVGKLQSNNFQFDANKGGTPFGFKLGSGEVIKGWDIGVAGMSVGGERRIIIPAHLGYGKKANGKIPANSTLVFDIKLLSVK